VVNKHRERLMKECRKHGLVAHALVPDTYARKDGSIIRFVYPTCLACRLECVKSWNARHPEKLRTEAIRAKDRARPHRGPKSAAAKARASAAVAAYRETHREDAKRRTKAWVVAHPGARHLYRYLRRARQRKGWDGSVARYWDTVLLAYGHRCAYCGKKQKLEQDHVIPVKRGGTHTIGNVRHCCARCNRRKSASVWSPRPWAAMLPEEANA
jgi:5-methylcytosine-specific restriction endonuclease McrA